MNHHYADIRSRIAEPPKWFDENAVPRYCEFSPDENAYIYADECALVLIGCQNCRATFKVAFSASQSRTWLRGGMGDAESFRLAKDEIARGIRDQTLHYGDPPNVGCCGAGPTMNCLDLKVLEYWRRGERREWVRDASLEILLPDHPEFEG